MKHIVVGTAGHIDHGKSALVRALTGIDPDRLEEEKRRGITIDLGFAHLDLGEELRVSFVDVPGHERFVKNMLAGAGGIDLVLLVVAADESIKPQTREHFDICRLLGLQKGLIAITKADLVEPEITELVRAELEDFIAGSFLERAPVVAVSARTGEGLERLRAELCQLGETLPTRPLDLPFRLPIDRAFVMKGFGAVVTGTLVAGRIELESEVEVFPSRRRARVRRIEVHNQPTHEAVAGQRTALNLVGVQTQELARGMVLAPPGMFEPSERLDSTLALLPTARRLRNRERVHFHCWAAETMAEVVLLNSKELHPGEQAYAQLRLAQPNLFLPGDRFVIRQFSPVTTIGGGVILDNQPPQHRINEPEVARSLEILERGDDQSRLELLTERLGEASIPALVARTGWPPSKVLERAQVLERAHRLIILGQPPRLVVHFERVQRLAQAALLHLEQFHAANPLIPSLPKEELRGRLILGRGWPGTIPSSTLFDAVLETLAQQAKVEVRGDSVRLAGREVQLTPEEQAAREQITRAFKQAGLAVPSAKEVLESLRIDRIRAERILQILLKEKVLVKVTEDLIFHEAALAGLREQLAQHKTKKGNRISVAIFKEATGLTRKYAIPLLEYLDREHVTRREGDERILL